MRETEVEKSPVKYGLYGNPLPPSYVGFPLTLPVATSSENMRFSYRDLYIYSTTMDNNFPLETYLGTTAQRSRCQEVESSTVGRFVI